MDCDNNDICERKSRDSGWKVKKKEEIFIQSFKYFFLCLQLASQANPTRKNKMLITDSNAT